MSISASFSSRLSAERQVIFCSSYSAALGKRRAQQPPQVRRTQRPPTPHMHIRTHTLLCITIQRCLHVHTHQLTLIYVPQLLCELVPFCFFCRSHFPQLVSKRGILQLKLLTDNRQGRGRGGGRVQRLPHRCHLHTHDSAYSNETMRPK